jgi:hypothetical protein
LSPEQYKLLLELTELFDSGKAQPKHLIQLKELLSMVNTNHAFSSQEIVPKNLSSFH